MQPIRLLAEDNAAVPVSGSDAAASVPQLQLSETQFRGLLGLLGEGVMAEASEEPAAQ